MLITFCFSCIKETPLTFSELSSTFDDNAVIETVSLSGLKCSPPLTSFNGEEYHKDVSKTLRIWPQVNDTEGFFIAKIIKK